MGTNKKYWKGLDELNETPEFVASTKNEFPQELSVDKFLADDKLKESSTGRRDFLKFLGFSVAAATVAACETPVIKVVPYAVKPDDITPGIANWYASSFYDGESYAGILVKTREGRPIHIKGNKDLGITKGGTNPSIIASVLSLYDSERLQGPRNSSEPVSWEIVDAKVIKWLKGVANKNKKVVLLSNTIISPSTLTIIEEFKSKISGVPVAAVVDAVVDGQADVIAEIITQPSQSTVEHIQYDAISYSGMREANLESFGERILPDYNFSKAKTVVSIGADFYSSWLLPTQFLGDFLKTRNPENDWMSRLHQFETNMSITGSNADMRTMIKPSEHGKVVALLHKEVTGKAVSGVDTNSLSKAIVNRVKIAAKELIASKGKSIVIAGANRKSIQIIVNSINSSLGNYSSTINLKNPINLYQSEDAKMANFVKEMKSGKVGALVVWGANPVYSYPDAEGFKEGLAKLDFSVSMSKYADETASLCQYICPDSHALESWDDFNPKASHYSLAQPTIRPIHDTRPAAESLMVWAGMAKHVGQESTNYYDYIRGIWEQYGFPTQSDHLSFHSYWSTMVASSCGNDQAIHPEAIAFKGKLNAAGKIEGKIVGGGDVEIALYQKSGIRSGANAGNPWLQELPDPISKVTWDNYITMSPAEMKVKGYNTGVGEREEQNMVTVTVEGVSLTLPVYPQPGQATGTVGIALGYGRGSNHEKIGKAAFHQQGDYGVSSTKTIGENAYKIAKNGHDIFAASLANTTEKYTLACTQTHGTVMARNSIVKETTFDIYKKKDTSAYNHRHTLHTGWDHEEKLIEEFNLWDEQPVKVVGHRWGMSIDLNLCVGCGSCVIACGSENNVPVVGKDEVRRGREMHWMRIDRYYASDIEATIGTRNPDEFDEQGFKALEIPADNPKVVHMPMLCQHCNHAPCETVCPVAATTHSDEGLNMMAYNRCIGTRYCANNCPYKVRRFNWFNYPSYRKFTEVNPAQDDLGRMVLNPDVVVRTRGVMEKCSFCIQKIQTGKLIAKKAERPVIDGDVNVACAESCPANAITFGDWNDTQSVIRDVSESKRAYQVLEEVGIKPNIWYQLKVRNEENEELEGIQSGHGSHGDDHAENEGGGEHGEENHEVEGNEHH